MTVILSSVDSGIGILKRMMACRRAMSPGIPVGAMGGAARAKGATASAPAQNTTPNPTPAPAAQAPLQSTGSQYAAQYRANEQEQQIRAKYQKMIEEQNEDAEQQQKEIDDEQDKAQKLGMAPHPAFQIASAAIEKKADEEQKELDDRSAEEKKKLDDKYRKASVDANSKQSPPATTRPNYGGQSTGQPMVGGIGGKQQAGTSAGSVVAFIISVLAGLLLYNASSSSGFTSLAFAIAPVLLIILGISFGVSGGKLTLFVMCALIMEMIFMTQGESGIEKIALPLLGPGLLVVGLLMIDAFPKNESKGGWMAGMGGLVASIFIIIMFTAPSAAYAFSNVNLDFLQKKGGDVSSASKTSISTMVQDFQKTYQKQMAMATGQYIEGDVDQTVKEEVGVEILDPYIMNPSKINEGELLEISARIKGYDPKADMHIATACHMQTSDAASKVTTTTGPNMNPGDAQDRQPKNFTGTNFDKEITCYPKISSCGKYVVTLSSQADNLRTDAHMYNYIMDKDTLEKELLEYAKSKDTKLTSQSQIETAKAALHTEIGTYKSVSEKGAIKTVMMTEKTSLIGIDSSTKIKLVSGIENAKDGWVMGVNKVEITIPSYLKPDNEYCKGWTLSGSKLTLSADTLNKISFKETTKGQQKAFPSCLLILNSGTEMLTEPAMATFLMLVDYNYIVQKTYNVEVRNSTGGTCTAKSTSSTSSSSSSSSKPLTKEDIQLMKGVVNAYNACKSKASGDSCGTSEYCTKYGEVVLCAPECEYDGANSLQGLNSNYGCNEASSDCKEGTSKSISCQSQYIPGAPYCCETKTREAGMLNESTISQIKNLLLLISMCDGKISGVPCSAGTCVADGEIIYCMSSSTSSSGSGKTMTSAEKEALISSIASQKGYDVAVLKAILAVESRGNAFGSDGRPIIRFEPHIFDAECGCADGVPPTFTPGAKRSVAGVSCDGGQSAEYACFEKAKTINENAAYKSISVGTAQILGRYPTLAGYSTAKEMYEAFAASEKAQIEGFFTFLEKKSSKMPEAIKNKDWTTIALLYNGKGQEQLYASKLQTNYGTISSQPTTMVA